jgi:hypothetical protein
LGKKYSIHKEFEINSKRNLVIVVGLVALIVSCGTVAYKYGVVSSQVKGVSRVHEEDMDRIDRDIKKIEESAREGFQENRKAHTYMTREMTKQSVILGRIEEKIDNGR